MNKAMLVILDGWGKGPQDDTDAIYKAHTPFVDSLYERYPNSELVTHGEEVGLPSGQMGNSEVGHLNLGAGRIVYQELLKINKAFADPAFFDQSPQIQDLLNYTHNAQKPIHLMGLLSDGGVHSHIDQLIAFVQYLETQTKQKIYIHAFTDGRDTDPHSGLSYIQRLQEHIDPEKSQIATIVGRYYAMDRDQRWPRIKLAYDALLHRKGNTQKDPIVGLQQSYDAGISDEFVKPIVLCDDQGTAYPGMQDGGAIVCFNFRTDRCRQIMQVLSQQDMPEEEMYQLSEDTYFLTFTRYDRAFEGVHVLFDQQNVTRTLGEVIDENQLDQIRIAETEKYPHVTYFFSGGREAPFEREVRILEDSPQDVATYDLRPEMSAYKIRDAILPELKRQNASFICLNFANTDMVGHTGVFSAAMKAAEVVDECLEEIVSVALENDYSLVILADHGNSDCLINPDGSPNTAHTMNPVPLFIVEKQKRCKVSDGKLGDIAPTILRLMDLEIPAEMTGKVLCQFETQN